MAILAVVSCSCPGCFRSAVRVVGEARLVAVRGIVPYGPTAVHRTRWTGSRPSPERIPSSSFITNGPYCATGSPIGRPCSTSTVAGPSALHAVAPAPASTTTASCIRQGVSHPVVTVEAVGTRPAPWAAAGVRLPIPPGGVPPAGSPPPRPGSAALTRAAGVAGRSVERPGDRSPGRARRSAITGRSSAHSIVKCGVAIFRAAGGVQPELEQLGRGEPVRVEAAGGTSQVD